METTAKKKKIKADPSWVEEQKTPSQDAKNVPAKRMPVKTFWIEDVSCSVWSREHQVRGQPRTFYSCSFERSFQDRDGAYRYSKSFSPESLGKLVAVAQQASEYIHGLQEA